MNDQLQNLTCGAFTAALSSAEPTPGGGGAAALVGALAVSLGSMAASVTAPIPVLPRMPWPVMAAERV